MIPDSSAEPWSIVSTVSAPSPATTTTTGVSIDADVHVSHTRASISGNMPPELSATVTITTPGTTASTQNAQEDNGTPPATSAHGTSPTSAQMTVVACRPACSPKIDNAAAPTAARASSSVVEGSARISRCAGMVQP